MKNLERCASCRKKIGPTDAMSVKHDLAFCSLTCLEMFARGRSAVGTPVDDYRQPRRAWRP